MKGIFTCLANRPSVSKESPTITGLFSLYFVKRQLNANLFGFNVSGCLGSQITISVANEVMSSWVILVCWTLVGPFVTINILLFFSSTGDPLGSPVPWETTIKTQLVSFLFHLVFLLRRISFYPIQAQTPLGLITSFIFYNT